MASRIGWTFFIAWAAATLFASGACRRESGDAGGVSVARDEAIKGDPVVFQVGESFYFNSDFENYVLRTLGSLEDGPSALTLSRLFDRFVEDKLLLESARMKQVSLSQEEMKDYLVKVKYKGLSEFLKKQYRPWNLQGVFAGIYF